MQMARDGADEQLRGMIRKLKSGQFRAVQFFKRH